MALPAMKIGNKINIPAPIIQGGMGVGVSNYTLCGAVAREGGLGCLSSVGLDRIVSQRHGKRFGPRAAIAQDVRDARALSEGNGALGMNIMVAVQNQYKHAVLGSMDGGVDAIISGAGLPLTLPEIANTHPRKDEVALIPILSSGRAVDIVCKRWQRYNRIPDAIIVEGPLAGGHLAWRDPADVDKEENKLENLVTEVMETAKKYGDIPVIAAGGIYTHEDIMTFINMGCVGVQMATRFLGTFESGGSEGYKRMLVESTKEDIVLATEPGSPSGLLFRVLKRGPFYQQALKREREPNCSKGYLLKQGFCGAKVENEKSFCICNGLFASANMENKELELYTVGSNAWRVDRVLSVKELMDELKNPTKN